MKAQPEIWTAADKRSICTIYPDGLVTTFGWRSTDAPVTTEPRLLSSVTLPPEALNLMRKALRECGATEGDTSLRTMAR